MLKEGDLAPLDIEVLDANENNIKLQDFLGQKIVLYFYPKDNTPGCTQEACDFRDFNSEFEKLGAKLIGVSADSVESHTKFANKHELPFDLWSDSEHTLSEAFGAWGKKSMFGKIGFGLIRSTFIIDENGKIIKVWPKVSVNGHTEEVLRFLSDYKEND
jgi:peroxiredoxin Q/BCP